MGARTAAYCALVTGLLLLYLGVRQAEWSVTRQTHAMLELSAALVALVVGILALVRFYSHRNDTLLLIGSAMIGTAALDSYHLLVASGVPFTLLSGDWATVDAWSWFGGRVFLALAFLWSWTAWRREIQSGQRVLSELRVYLEVGAFALLSIALFGLVPLPESVRNWGPIARPIELVPGVMFAIAAGGYLSKGNWRERPFEVWVVPALLVSAAIQFLFRPNSVAPLDAFDTTAHALKLVSYGFLFVGLVSSMFGLYRQVERSVHLIRHKNETLEAEVAVRRRAERQASASEQRYRTILETIQQGYFEFDLAGNLVFWNEALARLIGFSPGRLAGLNYRAYTSERHAADIFATFGDIYRTTAPVRSFDWEIVRPDGTRRHVQATAGPILGEDEEVAGFRGILNDITEQRAVETRLEEIARALERANEELRQFAAVASDDLQEPLRMVAGYARLLAQRYEGRLDEEADLFIRYMVDGVGKMEALIGDLLEYSRLQTHGRRFDPTPLEEVLGWVEQDLSAALDDAGGTLTRDEMPTVEADSDQMRQLFRNLLANAIKFRGSQPLAIHVGVRQRLGEWQIYVRDNGIGVDPEHRTRVFEIFERLHAPEAYEGTGIGLAICKRIVERHGGRIWVEPSPGQGATLTFTLPRERVREPMAPDAPGEPPAVGAAEAPAADGRPSGESVGAGDGGATARRAPGAAP